MNIDFIKGRTIPSRTCDTSSRPWVVCSGVLRSNWLMMASILCFNDNFPEGSTAWGRRTSSSKSSSTAAISTNTFALNLRCLAFRKVRPDNRLWTDAQDVVDRVMASICWEDDPNTSSVYAVSMSLNSHCSIAMLTLLSSIIVWTRESSYRVLFGPYHERKVRVSWRTSSQAESRWRALSTWSYGIK